jgi:hypothetical protein
VRSYQSYIAVLGGAVCFLGFAQLRAAEITEPPEVVAHSQVLTAAISLTPACVAAKKYVDLGAQHKVADIGALFAAQVDYIGPDGVARSRGQDVAKLYASMSKTKWAQLSKVVLFRLVPLHQNECFMEFTSGPPEGPVLYAVDHFIVGPDGKVIWFRPFFEQAFSFK